MRALLAALVALALAACAPPVDLAATRAACDLPPGVTRASPLPTLEGAPPISAACAAALGEDFGVDWASFGARPAAVTTPDRPLDRLLTGLYVGLAADLGAAGDLLDAPLHPGLRRDLERVAREADLDDASPAADLLYLELADRIDEIAWAPALDLEARYERGAVLLGPTDRFTRPPGIAVWALLAHEAMHWHQSGHLPCAERPDVVACDADAAGPLGLEAEVAARYAAHLPAGAPAGEDHCDAAWTTRRSACHRILGAEDHQACALPPRDDCEAGYSASKSG